MENLNQTELLFKEVQEMVRSCIQCGTCSASCLAASVMEQTPRHIWRMVQLGLMNEVLESSTFVHCASCYYCTLRCPRGLPLTRAMAALKEIAAKNRMKQHRKSLDFYRAFVKSVRRHGRVNETELMTDYLTSMKNPMLGLKYAPLGIKLLRKGKLQFGNALKGKGVLDNLFSKVEEMEARR